jgi:hypothetical protein
MRSACAPSAGSGGCRTESRIAVLQRYENFSPRERLPPALICCAPVAGQIFVGFVGQFVQMRHAVPRCAIRGDTAIIDEHLILRYTPAKTQFTSGAMVTHDLTQFRMVKEELEKVPAEARRGPLIVNPLTGLPYKGRHGASCGTTCARSLASPRTFGIATCERRP